MLRISMILVALAFFTSSYAQKVKRKGVSPITVVKEGEAPKYKVKEFAGKWQETSRKSLSKNEAVAFSDTLQLRFFEDKVEVRDAISMRMSVIGPAQVEAPDRLIAAGDQYTVRKLTANELVADDGEFIRVFGKKDKFYSETVPNTKVSKDTFKQTINIETEKLKGGWMVYAKKALPGTVSNDQPIIKSIEVFAIAADKVATGSLTFYISHTSYTEPCTITTVEDNLVIDAGKNSFKLKTYKLNENEFVFGDTEGLLYYARPF
jgi:hypothetical protein